MSHEPKTHTKYIPKGLSLKNGWTYSEEIGVREVPGDDVAVLELTQDIVEPNGEVETQYITLSLSQILTLREVLDRTIEKEMKSGMTKA